MFEDAQLLIDAVSKMESGALYILLGFLIYKVVIYTSTAGAVVFILKLAIIKVHDVWAQPESVKGKLDEIAIDREAAAMVVRALGRCTTPGGFIHKSNAEWLREAIEEKKDRQRQKTK